MNVNINYLDKQRQQPPETIFEADRHKTNEHEWIEVAEDLCQRFLGHTTSVFMERWGSGEYSWNHDQLLHCNIVPVALMLRLD